MVEDFLELPTSQQIKYLREGKFNRVSRAEKIKFLKAILQKELSSKTLAAVLKRLRELKYRDRFLFRKYLYHIDSSVSNAARKALSDSSQRGDSSIIRRLELLKGKKTPEKLRTIRRLIRESEANCEVLLLALLKDGDSKVREYLVTFFSKHADLNEWKLLNAFDSSVWYVRAAIIELLGNRKSTLLFERIDDLIADENVEVKLKLIESLLKSDNENVRSYLHRMRGDQLIWVRREAEKALAKL